MVKEPALSRKSPHPPFGKGGQGGISSYPFARFRVTSDLVKRIWEHKNNLVEGFTKHYNIHQLVWYELHESMESAFMRENRIKGLETSLETGLDRKQESGLAGFV
jgi:hypothetical protein